MTFTSPILITILLAFLPISASNQVTHLQDHNNTWDSVDCGKPKDYIMTNAGPNVMFKSDNLILDFKNLSTREIQSPE